MAIPEGTARPGQTRLPGVRSGTGDAGGGQPAAALERRRQVAGVGAQLRERRKAAGLSLRQFARTLGISASFLSQFETGKSRPSVATLYQICDALNTTIDELFMDPPAEAPPEPRDAAAVGPAAGTAAEPTAPARPHPPAADSARPGHGSDGPVVGPDRRQRIVLDSGVTWDLLSAKRGSAVDFMFVTYQVGGSSTAGEQLIRHPGVEYGFVLRGELEVTLTFNTYRLRAGDAISFDSTSPHRLRNVGAVPVEAIWFVHGRNAGHEH